MRYGLSTVALGLVLGLGATAAAQDPGAARVGGDCEVVSPELNQRLAAEPELRAQYSPQLARDLRAMRNVALQLEHYGQSEACDAIAQAMQQIIDDPERNADLAARSPWAGQPATGAPVDPSLGWQERQQAEMEQARPVTELDSRLRARELIGADVRSGNGRSIGEVDDLVLGESVEESYLVVSYGGFLGFGEDLSAVPMERVQVAADLDTVYVPLTEDQLDNAPTFSRGDQDWIDDAEWRQRNEEFYSGQS